MMLRGYQLNIRIILNCNLRQIFCVIKRETKNTRCTSLEQDLYNITINGLFRFKNSMRVMWSHRVNCRMYSHTVSQAHSQQTRDTEGTSSRTLPIHYNIPSVSTGGFLSISCLLGCDSFDSLSRRETLKKFSYSLKAWNSYKKLEMLLSIRIPLWLCTRS